MFQALKWQSSKTNKRNLPETNKITEKLVFILAKLDWQPDAPLLFYDSAKFEAAIFA